MLQPSLAGVSGADFTTRRQSILFRSGDTGTAVRASSAVPAVFQPVRIGSREYVDGGLSAPIPVHHARQMGAEFVIAVDISAVPEGNATGDAARTSALAPLSYCLKLSTNSFASFFAAAS